MQTLADFVSTLAHHFEPALRDASPLARVIFKPGVNGGIALDGAVQAK
jgi:hypothetical protein